jgi:hypothetical protein
MIIAQIAAINVLNIPRFQEDILHQNEIKDKDGNEKVYSIWTQIGINYAYHQKLIYILKEWIGYLAAVLSLTTLAFTIKTIKVNSKNIDINEMNNLKNAKSILQQYNKKEEKNNKNSIAKKIKGIFSKITNYIKKIIKKIYIFITSPAFIIQFSRVMSIAWMYFYRNYYSLGIFITVFFSFLFISTKSNKFLTIFLLTPMVFISLVCFHFSNINGFFENYEGEEKIKYLHFGLGKYEYTFLEYYAGNLFYIFIMFLIYSFNNSPQKQRVINKNEIGTESSNDKEQLSYLNLGSSLESLGADNYKIIFLSKGQRKEEKKELKKL